MAQTLRKDLGMTAAALRNIADTRLRDFEVLWKEGQFHSAVYMAGYALEMCLKNAICKNLKLEQLPVAFEFHELEPLLLFSGLKSELELDTDAWLNFVYMQEKWNVSMRYQDQIASPIKDSICVQVNRCLNDDTSGLVPWFRRRS